MIVGAVDRPRSDGPSSSGRSEVGSSPLSILLIDDNPHIAESLSVALRLSGHTLERASGPEEALSRLSVHRYDAILLDMNYAAGRTNGEEGLALLTRIMADDPTARVVVVTAHSGIRIAVEAMRAGAHDFVMKPWRNADLLAKLNAATARVVPTGHTPARTPDAEPARLIGESDAIARVREIIRRVGPTRAGVVVTGASGTGRSLVASALHAASPGAGEPMVRIDLRDVQAWDRIDECRGTVLLRHPDLLDAVDQARLLERLTGTVRCIAIGTDASAIDAALARRIAAIEIVVPALIDRGGDALLLARHFAWLAAARHGRPLPHFTPAAEAVIASTHWSDDVRGLAAAVERAVLLGDGEPIDAAALIQTAATTSIAAVENADSSRFDLENNERAVIEAALREHHHNVTHAAVALGLSRGALYRRIERYGL